MRSMTGFGEGEYKDEQFKVRLEIKSVNNRYLDIFIRLPRELSRYEMWLREKIQQGVVRGKLNVVVQWDWNKDSALAPLDLSAADSRWKSLKKLTHTLRIPEEPTLDHLLHFEELFQADLQEIPEERILNLLEPALNQAMEQFNASRDREGDNLKIDMAQRVSQIKELMEHIAQKGRSNIQQEFERLLQNVLQLLDEQKIDRQRLEQEVAIIADRVDITEEVVRLKSHLTLFINTLEQQGAVGKKLNFILQEMHREANTMNSKTTDIEIAHKVIRIKEEIEKLREQVQNIE